MRVGPSPVWLRVELAKVGVKSINNIVDYTNYFMLMTGQPLHAYDYDKVKALSGSGGACLVIRNPRQGEKLKLLGGKTIQPRSEAIMIATDKTLIGIGGVMGGADTEVDDRHPQHHPGVRQLRYVFHKAHIHGARPVHGCRHPFHQRPEPFAERRRVRPAWWKKSENMPAAK